MHDESLSYLRRLELGAETVHPKVSTAQYADQLRELADELLELVGPPAVPYSANAAELAALRRQQLDQQLNALRRLAGLASVRVDLAEHSHELRVVDAERLEKQHLAVTADVEKHLNAAGFDPTVGTMPATTEHVLRNRERHPDFDGGEPARIQFQHLVRNSPRCRESKRTLDVTKTLVEEAAELLRTSNELEREITNYVATEIQETAVA